MAASAADLIREFEGFSAFPYLCPAGVPTIGYGFTRYANGKAVTLRDAPMPQSTAESYLEECVRRETARVCQLCPRLADPAKIAALTDFTYNLGTQAFANSTLRQRVNEQDWGAVCSELARWVHVGRLASAGLLRRRQAEIDMIKASL